MADVIIIDDDRTEHVLMKRMVRKIRPELGVMAFSYAEEALSFLRSPNRKVPQLIFVDINMPRMSGFDFADRYQSLYNELKAGTQVWMMSHSIDPRDRARAEASPAIHGYLQKSASQAEYARIIEAACTARPAGVHGARRAAG